MKVDLCHVQNLKQISDVCIDAAEVLKRGTAIAKVLLALCFYAGWTAGPRQELHLLAICKFAAGKGCDKFEYLITASILH